MLCFFIACHFVKLRELKKIIMQMNTIYKNPFCTEKEFLKNLCYGTYTYIKECFTHRYLFWKFDKIGWCLKISLMTKCQTLHLCSLGILHHSTSKT